jgi:small subunit ribosomal protein S2
MEKNRLVITPEQLLLIRFHLGHKKNKINVSMIPFIYGFRHNITIFHLEKITHSLNVIYKGIVKLFAKHGTIFLASTQKDLPVYDYFKKFLERKNKDKDSNIHVHGFIAFKWINGIFTNYFFYRKLMDQITSVHEQLLNSRDKKYLKYLEGVQERNYFPHPDIAVLYGYNEDAAKEFNILAVPIIGILDSNATKESYFYGFPGNDDSFDVFQFFFEFLKKTELDGRYYEKQIFYSLMLFKSKKKIFE